jgi:hypothetical protein
LLLWRPRAAADDAPNVHPNDAAGRSSRASAHLARLVRVITFVPSVSVDLLWDGSSGFFLTHDWTPKHEGQQTGCRRWDVAADAVVEAEVKLNVGGVVRW